MAQGQAAGATCGGSGSGGASSSSSSLALNDALMLGADSSAQPFRSQVFPGEGMYKGAMANGVREGLGAFFHVNGNRYQGNWHADQAHGQGKMIYKDGSTYDGEWRAGRRHGVGSLTYAADKRARSYVGQWEEDVKHGRGRLTWFGGEEYEGDFYDGVMTGEGRYTFAAGQSYTGGFLDGKRHGHGVLTLADGSTEAGEWMRGKLVAKDAEESRVAFSTLIAGAKEYAKETRSQEKRLSTLRARFPMLSAAQVEAALQGSNGHAGNASATLERARTTALRQKAEQAESLHTAAHDSWESGESLLAERALFHSVTASATASAASSPSSQQQASPAHLANTSDMGSADVPSDNTPPRPPPHVSTSGEASTPSALSPTAPVGMASPANRRKGKRTRRGGGGGGGGGGADSSNSSGVGFAHGASSMMGGSSADAHRMTSLALSTGALRGKGPPEAVVQARQKAIEEARREVEKAKKRSDEAAAKRQKERSEASEVAKARRDRASEDLRARVAQIERRSEEEVGRLRAEMSANSAARAAKLAERLAATRHEYQQKYKAMADRVTAMASPGRAAKAEEPEKGSKGGGGGGGGGAAAGGGAGGGGEEREQEGEEEVEEEGGRGETLLEKARRLGWDQGTVKKIEAAERKSGGGGGGGGGGGKRQSTPQHMGATTLSDFHAERRVAPNEPQSRRPNGAAQHLSRVQPPHQCTQQRDAVATVSRQSGLRSGRAADPFSVLTGGEAAAAAGRGGLALARNATSRGGGGVGRAAVASAATTGNATTTTMRAAADARQSARRPVRRPASSISMANLLAPPSRQQLSRAAQLHAALPERGAAIGSRGHAPQGARLDHDSTEGGGGGGGIGGGGGLGSRSTLLLSAWPEELPALDMGLGAVTALDPLMRIRPEDASLVQRLERRLVAYENDIDLETYEQERERQSAAPTDTERRDLPLAERLERRLMAYQMGLAATPEDT